MRGFLISFFLFLPLLQSALAEQDRPNIVVILADDLGWGDVGFNGSEIRTPHVDWIANNGLKFASFYSLPVCTQTRAAFLTGIYPHKMGLHKRVIKRNSDKGLPTEEATLAERLKELGYQNALVGKWHLGHARKEYLPLQRGFDYHFGALKGFIDYYTHEHHGEPDLYKNGSAVERKGYITEVFSEEAIEFLKNRNKQKPFFLYLPYTAPHARLQAPEQFLEMYKDIQDKNRRLFAATVTALDESIGKVLDELRKQDILDDTIILFASDNGASIRAGGNNGPFRGKKGDLYEGGIRVPAALYWKGKVGPSQVLERPIHVVDLFPTLYEAASGKQSTEGLDGSSQLPLILKSSSQEANRSSEKKLLAIVHNGQALRDGDYKLIEWNKNNKTELYNLQLDPGEKKNLAGDDPQRREKMLKDLQKYKQQVQSWKE